LFEVGEVEMALSPSRAVEREDFEPVTWMSVEYKDIWSATALSHPSVYFHQIIIHGTADPPMFQLRDLPT
jgi:hypothetical protein